MNILYLEAQRYLEEIHAAPRLLFDESFKCFQSEPALYGGDPALNHRLHKRSLILNKRLYKIPEDEVHAIVISLIKAVTKEILEKLTHYRADQLPGGRLWDPPQNVRDLCQTSSQQTIYVRVYLGLMTGYIKAMLTTANIQ